MFTTSDIGWVVGHSYIVYGPLIHGMSTILYEGLPIRPDPGIWWKIVEQYKVSVMFSSPTAIRVLKRQEAHYLHSSDVSSLQGLYLAGEPLDEPTARWISEALKANGNGLGDFIKRTGCRNIPIKMGESWICGLRF